MAAPVLIISVSAPCSPEASSVGDLVEMENPPTRSEWSLLGKGYEWVLVRFGGEEPTEEDAWLNLARALTSLPPEAAGVRIRRTQESPLRTREDWVVRAFRPGVLSGVPNPCSDWSVHGRDVRASGVSLEFDRSSFQDAIGICEAAERRSDWVQAIRTWAEIGGIYDDVWGGYSWMRSALGVASLSPQSGEVRERLLRAIDRCPVLPEAIVAMAEWWLRQGNVDRALEWSQIADSARRQGLAIPQPLGIESWWIPATLGISFLSAGQPVGESLARSAEARGAPADVADRLKALLPSSTQGDTVPLSPKNGDQHG